MNWIVCETSGRWAAALRIALTRRATTTGSLVVTARVHEVRSHAELGSRMGQHLPSLGLIEVELDNLPVVLELIATGRQRHARLVALMNPEFGRQPRSASRQPSDLHVAAEALTEAGALAVMESPRHVGALLQMAERLSMSRSQRLAPNSEQDSLASLTVRAWAALPWQDA